MMTVKQARAIAGSLSYPSKMPGSSYALPTSACRTGSKLQSIPGTTCASCYALKGQMTWPNPRKAQAIRLASITDERWVDAMVVLLLDAHSKLYRRIDLGLRPGPKLKRLGTRYRLNEMGFHRWHDSGDLQSVEHLQKI